TKIDDRMPSYDALKVLRAMPSSREENGDFRLLVGEYSSYGDRGALVLRNGDRWRVDSFFEHLNVTPFFQQPEVAGWATRFVPFYSTRRPNPPTTRTRLESGTRSGWITFSRRSRAFGIPPSFPTPGPAAMRSSPVRTMAGVPYQKARSFR